MSPTTTQIHGSTSGPPGRIRKKKIAKIPPTPPPKYELRIPSHHENEEIYSLAYSDILRSKMVSCSSSPTIFLIGARPEAICSPSMSDSRSEFMSSHYRPKEVRPAKVS